MLNCRFARNRRWAWILEWEMLFPIWAVFPQVPQALFMALDSSIPFLVAWEGGRVVSLNSTMFSRLHFSTEELTDLLKAWVAISLAVALASLIQAKIPLSDFSLLVRAFAIYGVTVGVAFLAHEVVGHKLLAQRYGLFAEFRADPLFLVLSLLLSFTGFVFVAPGAVVLAGLTRIATYGKVAAAGPLVNILLALLFHGLSLAGKSLPLPLYGGQFVDLISASADINSWLALFNLIPIGVLDGAKVLAWNKGVWLVLTGLAVLLFVGVI